MPDQSVRTPPVGSVTIETATERARQQEEALEAARSRETTSVGAVMPQSVKDKIASDKLEDNKQQSWDHLAQVRKDVLASPAIQGKTPQEIKEIYDMMVEQSWSYQKPPVSEG